MNGVLHREHALSDMFVGYLLARNIRYEEDLVDQLFNSSEKIGTGIAIAGSFRQGRQGRECNPQDESGDPSRNDRHNSVASQFFPEQVQKVRLHGL
jgi:hypothetical protein